LDEPVGRYPTVTTTPGTSSSRKQKEGDKRTVRLRLLPSSSQERKLRKLADATAKLWNELNYVRLMQFRESGKVDFKGTGREFYRKYNVVLGVNAGQVVRLSNWAWKSFFETLRLYKQGKLPKFMNKLRRQASGRIRCLGRGS
jgi:transposase